MLVFYPEDAKWTKELSSYFLNDNLKVGHEPWTCVNQLCLPNPYNPNKTVSLLVIFSLCVPFCIFMSQICLLTLHFNWFVIEFNFCSFCKQSNSQRSFLFPLLLILP